MFRVLAATFSLLLALSLPAWTFELPRNSSQVVVGVTQSWESSHLTVYLYEKQKGRWALAGGPWNGRCGKSGLAWGQGLHPGVKGPLKTEGDWRTPAGVFRIGGAWGYDVQIKKHAKLPYRKVTSRDLWVEDPKSKHYNHHLVLGHEPRAAWEKKAQMKQDDYPHSLKLFIGHNSPPKPIPGAGSSIFFHIWRGGGGKPTSGCTTLPEANLRTLVARIDPDKNPLYVLLPKPDYNRLRPTWKLP
jgi:L,D-peptidoglycan transpeptidase YkuD (ErfK/YbiS/YcfS/YnhG family)